MLTVSSQTARRFILGRQGLWPGRRWKGRRGTAEAFRSIEAVQMDSLNVVARSHDIVLWSRVVDYRPQYLEQLLYRDRALFEYGGGLFIYPIEEIPYWRIHMRGRRSDPRWAKFATAHPSVLRKVRSLLRRNGPLGNRDLEGSARVVSYRGRKDTTLALYYLWLTGEVVIHHRAGFERVYDLASSLLGPEMLKPAGFRAAEALFARKITALLGLVSEKRWRTYLNDALNIRRTTEESRRRLDAWMRKGLLAEVKVEGWREPRFVLQEDLPLLRAVEAGGEPRNWRPVDTTTRQEVVFLAPLDIVSARSRARELFDFDYVWEVYKPANKRRWGYYTLPILYDDRLVGRLDPRLDRASATLEILGSWLEGGVEADLSLAEALGRGLARFARFLNARTVDLHAIRPPRLRARMREVVNERLPLKPAD